MIGKNNTDAINDINSNALHLLLNEAYKTPSKERHLQIMYQLMAGAAKLSEPFLEPGKVFTYDNLFALLREQACGTNQYDCYSENDNERYCESYPKRTILKYYTYLGPQSNNYAFDIDITYLRKQYVWFIEKYLIPQQTIIDCKTILYPSVIRPLTNKEMTTNAISVTLSEYINAPEESDYIYGQVIGAHGIGERFKKNGIFDFSREKWRKDDKSRSDTIRLKSYLLFFEKTYNVRLSDILKTRNIRHTIYADKAYNLGDIYAKMMYDISLALDFEFLVDAHDAIVNSEHTWTNCLCNALNLLADLEPIDAQTFCKQLGIILCGADTFVCEPEAQELSIIEGFYMMLLYEERVSFYKGILDIQKQIKELPDISFHQKLIGTSFITPIENAKTNNYQAVKDYIDEERISIRNFVFADKEERQLKKKWVIDNKDTIIKIIDIIDVHFPSLQVTPHLVYICFKLYNELDKKATSVSAIYDTNYRITSTKFDISKHNTNIANQIYLMFLFNKYVAIYNDETEWFEINNKVSSLFYNAMIKCFKINNHKMIAEYTQKYCNNINGLIELYRNNGISSNKHIPIVRDISDKQFEVHISYK